jgi:hypothetical protein
MITGSEADTEQPPRTTEAEPEPEPDLTTGQENALRSAEEYLDYSAFAIGSHRAVGVRGLLDRGRHLGR